jgi:hypothetical protein
MCLKGKGIVMKAALLSAIVIAGLSAGPAAAAIVNLTVNGTVAFGRDSLGLFGDAGTLLNGAAYQMNFAFEISNAFDGGTTRQVNGGTFWGRPSPIRRGDLLINGTTVSFVDPYSSYYGRFSYPTSSQLDVGSNGFNGIYFGNLSWSRGDQGIPLALDAIGSRTFDASDRVSSGFQQANQALTVFTYLQLQPTDLTISLAGGVPEPATWAMMIGGFGLIGAALRRRRRLAVGYA